MGFVHGSVSVGSNVVCLGRPALVDLFANAKTRVSWLRFAISKRASRSSRSAKMFMTRRRSVRLPSVVSGITSVSLSRTENESHSAGGTVDKRCDSSVASSLGAPFVIL